MTTQIVPGVRMRGNLKSVPEEPQYVEAKLSCTEFQEAKKLLFQVKTFLTSVSWPFLYQAGRLPAWDFMKLTIFRLSKKLNWEHGWRSLWSRMSLRPKRNEFVKKDIDCGCPIQFVICFS